MAFAQWLANNTGDTVKIQGLRNLKTQSPDVTLLSRLIVLNGPLPDLYTGVVLPFLPPRRQTEANVKSVWQKQSIQGTWTLYATFPIFFPHTREIASCPATHLNCFQLAVTPSSHLHSASAPSPLQHLPTVHLSLPSPFFALCNPQIRETCHCNWTTVRAHTRTQGKKKSKKHTHTPAKWPALCQPSKRQSHAMAPDNPLKIISAQGMNSPPSLSGNNVFNLDQPACAVLPIALRPLQATSVWRLLCWPLQTPKQFWDWQ